MEQFTYFASWVLLIGGSFFLMIGAIGVLRMPDVYTRSHAAGVTDTMGVILILGGLMIQGGFTLITAKLALILIFLLFTSRQRRTRSATPHGQLGSSPSWTGIRR
jgi:multicomponent Na+:H+ antiporter subunit G